jgi:hypothetical protein
MRMRNGGEEGSDEKKVRAPLGSLPPLQDAMDRGSQNPIPPKEVSGHMGGERSLAQVYPMQSQRESYIQTIVHQKGCPNLFGSRLQNLRQLKDPAAGHSRTSQMEHHLTGPYLEKVLGEVDEGGVRQDTIVRDDMEPWDHSKVEPRGMECPLSHAPTAIRFAPAG